MLNKGELKIDSTVFGIYLDTRPISTHGIFIADILIESPCILTILCLNVEPWLQS